MKPKTAKAIARTLCAVISMLALISAAACGGDSQEPPDTAAQPAAAKIKVVATSNIIADWAREVGGDHVEVVSLMPVDVDPHTFQPGPRDAAQIAEADLVLAVGLEMEGFWLEDLLRSVARDAGIVLALGDVIDPGPLDAIAMGEDDAHDDHEDENEGEHEDEEDGAHADDGDEGDHAGDAGDGHVHGEHNPHFWFDPIRAMSAVEAIAARFAELDPANAYTYRANAAVYKEELHVLHHWIEEQVKQVAPERRLLLTSHDSFRYFADRYGFEVVGVILGVSTDAEASAEHLAELVELIKSREVAAVFGETVASERLAQTLANEAGATLVRLYSDSVGAEGSGAETFVGMLRINVERVVEALR